MKETSSRTCTSPVPVKSQITSLQSNVCMSCLLESTIKLLDWALDWGDPAASPIWDPTVGFSGDGDPRGGPIIGSTSCIKEGPFADYEAHYYNYSADPHCLSCGFGSEKPYRFSGEILSPSAMEEVRGQDSFFNFSLTLKKGPHNPFPNGIGGDFLTFKDPSDPVFFLHHTQLDHLLWLWQKEETGRMEEYNGPSRAHSDIPASLDDNLPINGLAEDILVRDIMSTDSVLLSCEY